MANLTLRSVKGSALTIAEMDENFEYFTGSYTNTGTITATGFVGDVTGSVSGSVTGNADTATTASYVAGADVDGYVALATDADLATTASYVDGANVDGYVALTTNADNAATASYDQNTLSWKMSEGISSSDSRKFSATLPKMGMMLNGVLYELVMSEQIPSPFVFSLHGCPNLGWCNLS